MKSECLNKASFKQLGLCLEGDFAYVHAQMTKAQVNLLDLTKLNICWKCSSQNLSIRCKY